MVTVARASGVRASAEFPIELIESAEGSLADLNAFLCQQGLMSRVLAEQPEAGDGGPVPRLRLVEIGPNRSAAWLSSAIRAGRAAGPTVAIVHSADSKDLSKALASGCDDAFIAPLDPDDLLHRLDAVATLARLQSELARRNRALAEFGAKPPRDHLKTDLPRPHTLVVGPASQAQVRIMEMLGDTPIAFTDTCDQARRLLLAEPFDLVIFSATSPTSHRDAVQWPVEETDGPISLLFSSVAETEQAEIPVRFDDHLSLQQAIESLCLRLQFWRKAAGYRRALREGPANALADMTVDGLTGLANHGFLFAYADQCRADSDRTPRALLLARLANLRDINRQHGFPQGNQALRRMGRTLRRHLRASDLLSHLGGGRFAAVLSGVGREELTAILRRVEVALGQETSPGGDWGLRAQLRGGLVDHNEPLPEALERFIAGSTRSKQHAA